MSRTRRAFVAVVSIILVATAAGALVSGGSHHHPVRPAAVVRSLAPATVATAEPAPSGEFDAEAFEALLTRIDPRIANQLIGALSPADRAALANEIETKVGLSAG